MMLDVFHKLSPSALHELAASLRGGSLAGGLTTHAVQQIVGGSMAGDLVSCLHGLFGEGWSPSQVATLAHALAEARGQSAGIERQFDLVLSGPDVPGIPTRDTAAVMHTMIEAAEKVE